MMKGEILKIARVTHETVRTYLTEQDGKERKTWSQLKHKEQENICKAVKLLKENPRTRAHSVHNAWIDKMIEAGWTYGREYNKEEKTDPQMVSYRGLPPIRRKNDKLFHSIVKIGMV